MRADAARWRAVLAGRAEDVAPRLLGATLCSDVDGRRVSVRLTEVEAYAGVGEDPGSHAHRGPTPRNTVMFGPPGHLYVYFTYGMHWCANVVCRRDGHGSAVLLRGAEVIEGLAVARARGRPGAADRDLARGPARLTRALGLGRSENGLDLLDPRSPVRLLGGPPREGDTLPRTSREPAGEPPTVATGPRVGVGGAAAQTPWRFWLVGEPTVSTYRPWVQRRRAPARPAG